MVRTLPSTLIVFEILDANICDSNFCLRLCQQHSDVVRTHLQPNTKVDSLWIYNIVAVLHSRENIVFFWISKNAVHCFCNIFHWVLCVFVFVLFRRYLKASLKSLLEISIYKSLKTQCGRSWPVLVGFSRKMYLFGIH